MKSLVNRSRGIPFLFGNCESEKKKSISGRTKRRQIKQVECGLLNKEKEYLQVREQVPTPRKMYSYLIKMLLTLSKSHVDVQQIYQIMIKFLTVFLLLFTELFADLWEQDVTPHIQIGLAETGYKRVDLKCGASSFLVNVTLENDFGGVIYTRGSFDNKTSSCFKNHKQAVPFDNNSVLITLNIPFNECHTLMDVGDSQYRNIVIVQHEPEFIMPGDAAFALDCSFTPEFTMTTNMVTEPNYKSRITLVDADPGSDVVVKDVKYQNWSDEETVSFFPVGDRSKDEL